LRRSAANCRETDLDLCRNLQVTLTVADEIKGAFRKLAGDVDVVITKIGAIKEANLPAAKPATSVLPHQRRPRRTPCFPGSRGSLAV
jgi:hypothetical protein